MPGFIFNPSGPPNAWGVFLYMDVNEIIKASKYEDAPVNYPAPSITIQGKTVAHPGNFITLTGLPKNYKSTVMAFFVASALTGRSVFDISVNLDGGGVCIIDTEQAAPDFYLQVQRLKLLIGVKRLPENFTAYTFRKHDPPEILKALQIISENRAVKFLVVDNLTELVMNPNDMIEAKQVIQLLKKITADRPDLTIMAILHLGKTNFNSLGNLGSYADRAAQSVIKVNYDEQTNAISIEPAYMRSSRAFKPFGITFNEDSKAFEYYGEIEKPKQSRRFVLKDLSHDDHVNRLGVVFRTFEEYSYAELIEEIKKIYGVGSNIAKQQIMPYLLGNGYLTKDKSQYKQNR